ncbi:hypothetical protein E4U30_006468 [Claviceps sp. LM220 group G6]|nr:hypothetical protein E4U30_006468 [Claviceps sp. LM220 group G6]
MTIPFDSRFNNSVTPSSTPIALRPKRSSIVLSASHPAYLAHEPIGLPSAATFSAADLHWQDLARLMPRYDEWCAASDAGKARIARENLKNSPHIAASYFCRRRGEALIYTDSFGGAGEVMNVLAAVSSLLIDETGPPVTNGTGGTSKGNPNAGGKDNGERPPKPITMADKAGAGFVTFLMLAARWRSRYICLDERL